MGGAEVYAALIANMHAGRGHPSLVIMRTEPGLNSSRFADNVNVSYLHQTRDTIRKPMSLSQILPGSFHLQPHHLHNHWGVFRFGLYRPPKVAFLRVRSPRIPRHSPGDPF